MIRESEHTLSRNSFAQGYCAEFAIALHEKTGFPIVSFDEVITHDPDDIENRSIHYAVKNGNKFIDCRGSRTEQEIRAELLGSDMQAAKNVDLRQVDINDLEHETEINQAALKQARRMLKSMKNLVNESSFRIYNKTLEPNLWDENKNLDPEVRLNLLKIAQDFYKSTDFKSEIIDILLLGSSINYNWTPESDLDVHIVIDINKEGLDPEHYRKFLDSIGGKWNQEHDITIKGHNVEIYIQDITEKNSTVEKSRKHGAMFSLLNNKWLLAPSYEKPSLDKETIKKEFYRIKDEIDVIVKDRNIDGLKDLMKRIREYRNKGLEGKDGEFSTENIVFKALRHTGVLEKLKNSVNSIYDRMVTIKENEKYLKEVTQIDVSIFEDVIEETIRIIEEESKPYILVGASDRNGYVAAIKQEHRPNDPKLFTTQNHKILYNRYHDLDRSTGIDWRYRSDINELLWWDWPSEAQSEATREYLKSNYGVTNPKYINAQNRTQRDILSFHSLKYEYKDSRELDVKDIFEEIYSNPSFENTIIENM